jgi:glycosyltransferase involved in cell wall biosynthesis
MKVVMSHPTGNRNVRAVLNALYGNGILSEFNTTIAVQDNAPWLKLLPGAVKQELLRRTFPVPSKYICAHPALEIARIALLKLKLSKFTQHETGWASVDAVYQNLDAAVANRLDRFKDGDGNRAVYAYEDGALETFKRAKDLGYTCVYDLPIAYWETGRKLMQEEAQRLPHWAKTLGGGITDSAAKLERKTRELELADVVVGPGKFVIDSLPHWAAGKQRIVSPFGSPDSGSEAAAFSVDSNSEKPLRVLFAGSMGQRKGLGDLFAAVKLLNRKDVELVVMGAPRMPIEFYYKELPGFVYEPGRANNKVLELMRSCDVFCLPSVVEGRALVMQEAMSQGLPLIITPNTGGEDLVHEGKTGFLVPIRSPELIAEKIAWFADNRQETKVMGEAAQKHAQNYTWENYGSTVVNSLIRLGENI